MIASSSAVLLSPVCVGYTEVPVIFSNRLSLIKLPILSFFEISDGHRGPKWPNGVARIRNA